MGVGLEARHHLARDRPLDEPLDVAQEHVLVDAHQRDRLALVAGAAGAADAVHVILGHVGQVVVDDVRQLVDVDAAGRDVGGDHHLDLARLERGERPRARVLALVSVQGDRADAVGVQRADHLVGAVLGPREHQHLSPAVVPHQPGEQLALLVAVHRMHALRDRVDRRVGRRHLDDPRLVQELRRERLDLGGERRREQQVLPLPREQREHALDVGDEAHVEHAIGLVEDEDLDARKVDVALPVVVEQAPWCRHQDVDAALQLRGLRAEAHATEQHHRRQLEVPAVGLDRRLDLRGELARRREDQRPQRLARAAGVRRRPRGQPLQHGQHEAGGLAGARLRAGKEVAAREDGRNRLRLDRRRRGVTLVGHRAQQRVGQPELGKGHDSFRMCARPFAPLRERPVTAKREVLRRSESTAARGLEQRPRGDYTANRPLRRRPASGRRSETYVPGPRSGSSCGTYGPVPLCCACAAGRNCPVFTSNTCTAPSSST